MEGGLKEILYGLFSHLLLSATLLHITAKSPSLPDLLDFHLTRKETINIIKEIGSQFKVFGIFLLQDEKGTVVDTLYLQNSMDPSRITMAILQRWMQGEGMQPPTWAVLLDSLRRASRNQLASTIENVSFCMG